MVCRLGSFVGNCVARSEGIDGKVPESSIPCGNDSTDPSMAPLDNMKWVNLTAQC